MVNLHFYFLKIQGTRYVFLLHFLFYVNPLFLLEIYIKIWYHIKGTKNTHVLRVGRRVQVKLMEAGVEENRGQKQK